MSEIAGSLTENIPDVVAAPTRPLVDERANVLAEEVETMAAGFINHVARLEATDLAILTQKFRRPRMIEIVDDVEVETIEESLRKMLRQIVIRAYMKGYRDHQRDNDGTDDQAAAPNMTDTQNAPQQSQGEI